MAGNKQISTVPNQFQPIEQVTSPAVSIEQAAFYLNRRPHTLRVWAMREYGIILPERINGRLAWSVKKIKKALGMEK